MEGSESKANEASDEVSFAQVVLTSLSSSLSFLGLSKNGSSSNSNK